MAAIVHVKPGKSIGEIHIGMSKNDAEKLLSNSQLSFQIEYEGDIVSFVEINAGAEIEFSCYYNNIDLFKTKASKLVDILDAISPYDREDSDGFTYRFPKLGLVLWRNLDFSEEDMEQPWFKEMPIENQEDTMRSLYFETVGVFIPE
ncbi:hypothetical protein [Paenibacillus wenxiniae]|uniref:Uncharacterized protein n=1 Tax=Paenibacillus wenxiniae TaxID=1636843 RepID=A0ABW4RJV2_9BACL